MKRVFVSYSRQNLDVVTQLIQDLQAVGVQAWYDQTLTGGQRWWDDILSNIRECDIFIFALSRESWESEACRGELAYVLQLSKVVLPVLVADGINLNLLPPPISQIQVTDYRQCDKAAAFALVKSIGAAPATPPLPDPLPLPPKVPVSYMSNLKERIDSTEPLSSHDQMALVFEIEAAVRDGRAPDEIQEVLLSFKRRDDLLAKIGARLDEALKALKEKTPVQGAASAAAKPAQTPPVHHSPAPPAPPVYQTGPSPARAAGTKSRRYACRRSDSDRLIDDVKRWLDVQGFDLQQMQTENQGVLLQIKRRGGWRDFVGMATALNIVFTPADDTLNVEIGSGKWLDKAAVGTVSIFILWPLAITAGFGAWDQMKMPDKIFAYIENRFVYA
jgi:hypothetical protein